MGSRSKATAEPTTEPTENLPDALAGLDASLDSLAPPPEGGEGAGEDTTPPADAPKKRGRPKGSRTRSRKPSEPTPPPEPPSPAMLDAYGSMGAGIVEAGFGLAGRFVGGRPETWDIPESERVKLARALGPALALHHDRIGAALPYAEPVMLIYGMFSERYAQAKREVAGERERIADTGAKGMPETEGGTDEV